MVKTFEIRVRGQVQGVGFRPFIFQLADRFGAKGHVLNDAEGVLIRVHCARMGEFLDALRDDAPPLARIDAVEAIPKEFDVPPDFTIAQSGEAGAETRVTPDAATCADCIAEIRASGRRQGYAFTNCTNCGPRFTILRQLPYDRAQTTMAPFEMCDNCRAEYKDPLDRRFHAQPIACPACGPHLRLEPPDTDPLGRTVERLYAGEILAIKGLGGFHIACDATNADAVARLRERKHRPTKPLALMATMDLIRAHAAPGAEQCTRLSDPAAPIVLIPRSDTLPEALAPGLRELGWMLPYTPLHHLLFDRFKRPLVMTSGNLSGEPQVIGNDEAMEKLGPIADAILMHDRDIARRLDDSLERLTEHGPMILRRARGHVPGTLPLPDGFAGAPDVVAYGAHLKSAICLTKNGQALLSHHLGDLDDPLTWEEFVKADRDYADLFDHAPVAVACDLHPDYRSSRHAEARGLPVYRVQHHHAHMAACMAENGWPLDGGKVAGIILDGLGLGLDGTIWGGEILVGDYAGFERRHWLTPASLPGGDAAGREPWRNAMMRLDAAGHADLADTLFPDKPRDLVRQAVASGVNAPLSSSAGRLFDAFAACLGLCPDAQSFEGEAAMRLEASADESVQHAGFDFGGDQGEIDPGTAFEFLADALRTGKDRAWIAAHLHAGLARAFAARARALVKEGEAQAVVLSGGCFQNALLLDLTIRMLRDVPLMIHTKVPANDGGLALGQALVAQAQLETP